MLVLYVYVSPKLLFNVVDLVTSSHKVSLIVLTIVCLGPRVKKTKYLHLNMTYYVNVFTFKHDLLCKCIYTYIEINKFILVS